MKECFKNKEVTLTTNTASTIQSYLTKVLCWVILCIIIKSILKSYGIYNCQKGSPDPLVPFPGSTVLMSKILFLSMCCWCCMHSIVVISWRTTEVFVVDAVRDVFSQLPHNIVSCETGLFRNLVCSVLVLCSSLDCVNLLECSNFCWFHLCKWSLLFCFLLSLLISPDKSPYCTLPTPGLTKLVFCRTN